MFVEEDSVRSPLMETENVSPFGAPNMTQSFLPHPVVCFFHICFRGSAIFFYIMCSYFSDSFISSFVIVILLLSLDFWTVKNITGRILVGLRWWNYIDDDGKSHWVYESRQEAERHLINGTESKLFWTGLILFPFLWGFMFIAALFTFKFKWLVLVIIALTLNGSNVYGYLKCKFGKSDQGIKETLGSVTSNLIREQVMRSVITSMANPQNQGGMPMNVGQPRNI